MFVEMQKNIFDEGILPEMHNRMAPFDAYTALLVLALLLFSAEPVGSTSVRLPMAARPVPRMVLRGGDDETQALGSLFDEPDSFFEPMPTPGSATYLRHGHLHSAPVELVTAARNPLWVTPSQKIILVCCVVGIAGLLHVHECSHCDACVSNNAMDCRTYTRRVTWCGMLQELFPTTLRTTPAESVARTCSNSVRAPLCRLSW
jgi:hypothetical protein